MANDALRRHPPRGVEDWAGRLLVAALFAAGVAQKATTPEADYALLARLGLPGWLTWPALALNAAGAVLIVTGHGLPWVARGLAAYCAVTSVFHLVPDDPWQISIFVKNWAIAGALLMVAALADRRPHRPDVPSVQARE